MKKCCNIALMNVYLTKRQFAEADTQAEYIIKIYTDPFGQSRSGKYKPPE